MTEFSAWDSYFYAPPHDRTLRNLLDERDPAILQVREYGRALFRQRQIEAGEVDIALTYDAAHVRAIHRYLFADVYEWAGRYRTVNLFKGARGGFADVHAGEIDRYLTDVQRLVNDTKWPELDPDEIAERAATVFAYLNQAHPFREGNGRTSKVFMAHVAQRSRFSFDFSAITPAAWNTASMLSGPDLGRYEPVPASLVPVFRVIAVPRPPR